ncbi:MAG TPA: hypothetical protein VKE69_04600, partial [Planctomycetota bacterium]|nr:hypothetical protein [Planctomycetota bacterium]
MGSHPGLALLASFVLAQGADDRLPAIDEQAKSPDVQKKAQALLEYAKVGTPEALRRLLPYFEESEHYLVDVATLALSRSASNESLKTVVTETLAKGSPRARVAVLDALTMTKANIGAGDIAAKQLADPEAEVKLQALEVLLVSSPSEVPPAVVKLATSAQADVRQRATALLVWATLDPEAAKATLEKARSDKSPTVRVGAMLGLEKAKAGVAAGLGALADKDRRVRFGAVAMLERARKPEVVPKLIERLPAESGRLKDRIALALKAITGRDFGEDPAAWSRWWSTEGASFSPA